MPPLRRQPLGEATPRVNNSQDQGPITSKASENPGSRLPAQHKSQARNRCAPMSQVEMQSTRNPPVNAQRAQAIKHQAADLRRNSHNSAASGAFDQQKTHIGPWNLGKTLGEGATARVRKARHRYTGAVTAVKIVMKTHAQLSQAGSLANFDRRDQKPGNGIRQMPLGIEREVAIMKLIDHPHVMKLYDIWENHNEIYLVLEFVDNGELFEYISRRGKLEEPETMKYWRQILSAVGYCHSFNICHRDLKPENILLTKEGNIKIADFGMAALHQDENHRLNTSCGSPHYAAPEVINGSKYVGDKVDIWSMGIIIYATLAGHLPFDHPGPGIQGLLGVVKKGVYKMSTEFSTEARDLIYRILRLSPNERPTITQIWNHALLRKYDYLDNLSLAENRTSPASEECHRTVRRVSDIDLDLLRHLRSMWHKLSEAEIIEELLGPKPNEQKRFYALLCDHRDSQQEQYTPPDHEWPSGDYHHMRPLNQVRKLSTRQFSQPTANGGHKITRFTVVGNGKKDPATSSYDPFVTSRPPSVQRTRTAHSNFTVFGNAEINADRNSPAGFLRVPSRVQNSSGSASSSINNRHRPPGRKGFNTRSSLASSTRSRGSAAGVVKPNVGHKHHTAFHHVKVPTASDSRASRVPSDFSDHFEDADELSELRPFQGSRKMSGRYIRSKKATGPSTLLRRQSNRISHLWEEDLRQVSTNLERDCETAFNKNAIEASIRAAASGQDFKSKMGSTQLMSFLTNDPAIVSSPRLPRNLQAKSGKAWWDQRPLPPAPARSESVDLELAEARRHAEYRKAQLKIMEDSGNLDHRISHIDRLLQADSSYYHAPGDRRIKSAPVPNNESRRRGHLVSIAESSVGSDLSASAAAEEPRGDDDRTDRHNARPFSNGIRVVPESSPVQGHTKPNVPFKKHDREKDRDVMTGATRVHQDYHNHGQSLRDAYKAGQKQKMANDLPWIDEYENAHDAFEENSNGTVRHKASWFRRSAADPPEETIKKKGFGLGSLFKKREQLHMVIGMDAEDTTNTSHLSNSEDHANSGGARLMKDLKTRQSQLEPHQSWIARIFKVKPLTRYICCSTSRRKAREEICYLFKEWKRYGIRDIVINKGHNMVFAKVMAPNVLHAKDLEFAAEVLTVIQHGRRDPLCIVRLTQVNGAASSLNKVTDNIVSCFEKRGMMVKDKARAKMMVKTLTSSST